MSYKILAPCLTTTALLISIGAGAQNAAREPSFPAFAPPPVTDTKGQALFKDHCSGCHDQKESRAPATAYLSTRLPSEIIYTLTKGEMVTQAAGLSGDDIHAIAHFLTGRDIDAEAPDNANLCKTPGQIATDPKQWAG